MMLSGKRVLAVVPARGGSKGVQLKNLRPINGTPLVALVGAVVRRLSCIDRAIISTDHPKIAAAAREAGLDVPFMRPASLSGDIVSDWDVLNHALLACEKLDNTRYDIVVMLQPTSPFRKPEHVTTTISKLIDGGYDAVWTVSQTDSKAHPIKQLVVDGDKLEYYDKASGAGIIARQQLQPVYHRNGVAYAITRDCIIGQGNIKGEKTSFVVIDDLLANIDTELDFTWAEFLLQAGISVV